MDLVFELAEIIGSIIGSLLVIILYPILKVINWKRNKIHKQPKSIIITGASSGIGKSLSISYAGKDVNLCLFGRNEARLNEVAAICKSKGSIVEIVLADVSNKEAMKKGLLQFDNKFPVDLLIANAGVIESQLNESLNFEDKTYELTNTNVVGMLNTVLPISNVMQSRGNGQIVIVSSLSCYFSTFFPAYSASKSFCTLFGKTLRNRLSSSGVGVSVVLPGFVDTPMTGSFKPSSIGSLPFSISAEKATEIIKKGIQSNKGYISFPFIMQLLGTFYNSTPSNLHDPINYIASLINSDIQFHDSDLKKTN